MKENKMKLSELGFLLEYEDERSTINWCKKHKIPVIIAGKAKYVMSVFIDMFFKNQLVSFVNQHCDKADEILNAIESDNSLELSELLKAPINVEVTKKYKAKVKERSKASTDFLNNIKAA